MVPRVQTEQREPATSSGHRRIARDQLAQTTAIDVWNHRKIHHDLMTALEDETLALVLEQLCAVADGELPAQIEDGQGGERRRQPEWM